MSGHQVTYSAVSAGQDSLVSPMFHRVRVKHEIAENGLYIKENNNSLSLYIPFTPTPSRDARPRVCVCVREVGGER